MKINTSSSRNRQKKKHDADTITNSEHGNHVWGL